MKIFLQIPVKCWYSTLTVLVFLLSTSAFAGGTFKGKTIVEGNEFEVGEQFLVEYKLLASGSYSLRNPKFGISTADFGDLKIVRQGQDRNMSFGFGDNSVFNYKYFLKAKKPGVYNIPAITITMDGKSYKTQSTTVNIVKATVDNSITGDLLLKLKPNKSSVYVGEDIRYDLIWYSAFDAEKFELSELPKFDGFVVKTIQSQSKKKLKTINGKKYLTRKRLSFVLTPIKSGKIKLPDVKGNIYLKAGRGFFTQYEQKKISSGRLTLNVKPLPTPPKGVEEPILVGKFKLKTKVDKKSLQVNDAVTIRLAISGKGNLNTLNELNLQFPTAFEMLPATIKDNVKTDMNGVNGSKTFEFVAIPRQPGEFKVPAISINAFNPKTKKYYKLTSKEITLKVTGTGSADANPYSSPNSGSAVELQGSDIRYINDITALETETDSDFTNSTYQYIILFLVLCGFVFGSFAFKERKFSNAEVKTNKKAKANKVAQKYLKDAQKELSGDKNKFYELVDEAINNYLLGKLMIDRSELKKEKIKSVLLENGVNQELIDRTLKISDECKMARFSPMVLPPNEMYSKAEGIINELESKLK